MYSVGPSIGYCHLSSSSIIYLFAKIVYNNMQNEKEDEELLHLLLATDTLYKSLLCQLSQTSAVSCVISVILLPYAMKLYFLTDFVSLST
jgi:hypothetical protein